MRRFFRENGLSLVLFGLFLLTLVVGQSCTGPGRTTRSQEEHGQPQVELRRVPAEPATSWRRRRRTGSREFLQMFALRGPDRLPLPEGLRRSRKLGRGASRGPRPAEVPRQPGRPLAGAPGGLGAQALRELAEPRPSCCSSCSPSSLHAVGGPREYNEEQRAARPGRGLDARVHEHVALLVRVVPELAERVPGHLGDGGAFDLPAPERSPESKPVDSPHGETGTG